jgi:hypothetical protein
VNLAGRHALVTSSGKAAQTESTEVFDLDRLQRIDIHAAERCARMRQIHRRAAAFVEAVVSGESGRTLGQDEPQSSPADADVTPALSHGCERQAAAGAAGWISSAAVTWCHSAARLLRARNDSEMSAERLFFGQSAGDAPAVGDLLARNAMQRLTFSLELADPENVAVRVAEEGALNPARQGDYSIDADPAASELLDLLLDVLYLPSGDGAIQRLRGPLEQSQASTAAAPIADGPLDLVLDAGQADLAFVEASRSLDA